MNNKTTKYRPFLNVGSISSSERKELKARTQDTRYGVAIENGGWYEPCYVLRFMEEYVTHEDSFDKIVDELEKHIRGRV